MSVKAVLIDGMVVLDDSVVGERTIIAGATPGPQVDLSTLGNGVLQQTVSDGVAALSVTSIANPLAKYIVQQPDASVPNAQALSALSTGLIKNTTATGVLSVAIDGVDYVAPGDLKYQTVQIGGASQPQQLKLNFVSGATATNNVGNNSTDINIIGASVYADGIQTGVIELASISTALLQPGSIAYVASVDDYFSLQLNSQTVDNITVVTAFGRAGYQWIRMYVPSVQWAAATAWWVDPSAGNDEATGVSVLSPLASYHELSRRLLGRTSTTAIVVNPVNDALDTDLFSFSPPVATSVTFQGIETVVASGTVASAIAPNFNGGNVLNQVTISGFDWSPYVGKAIRKSGGSGGIGTYSSVVSNLGGGVAVLSPAAVNFQPSGSISFGSGDVIQVLSLTKCPQIQVSNVTFVTVVFCSLYRTASSYVIAANGPAASVTVENSVLGNGVNTSQLQSRSVSITNTSVVGSADVSQASNVSISASCLTGAGAVYNLATSFGGVVAVSDTLLYPTSPGTGPLISIGPNSTVRLLSRTSPGQGVGIFNLPAGGVGIGLGNNSTLAPSFIYGANNNASSWILAYPRGTKVIGAPGIGSDFYEASSSGVRVDWTGNATANSGATIPNSLAGSASSFLDRYTSGRGPAIASASALVVQGMFSFREWNVTGSTTINTIGSFPEVNGVTNLNDGMNIELDIQDGLTITHAAPPVGFSSGSIFLAGAVNAALPAGSHIVLRCNKSSGGTASWSEVRRDSGPAVSLWGNPGAAPALLQTIASGGPSLFLGSNGTNTGLAFSTIPSTSITGGANGVAFFNGSGFLTDDPTHFSWNATTPVMSIGGSFPSNTIGISLTNTAAGTTSRSALTFTNDVGDSSAIYMASQLGGRTLSIGPNPGGILPGGIILNAPSSNGVQIYPFALATTAQGGFFSLNDMPGVPVNAPSNIAGQGVQTVFDTADDRLYGYNTSWKIFGQFTGGLVSGYLKNTTVTGVFSSSATIPSTDVTGNANDVAFFNASSLLSSTNNFQYGQTTQVLGLSGGGVNAQTGISVANTNAGSAASAGLTLTNDQGDVFGTALASGAGGRALKMNLANGGGIFLTNSAAGVAFATSPLLTTAQHGFMHLQTMVGVPVGTGITILGSQVPCVVDTTDDRLYVYNTSWKPYGQFTGGLVSGYLKNTATSGLWTATAAIPESDVTNLTSDLASKQPVGNYITATTGDVVATGPGSVAAVIQVGVVTYAKIQAASAHVLIGNPTASSASVSEIALGSGLAFFGTTLVATGSGGTVTNVTGTPPIVVATGTTTPAISLNIDGTLAVVSSNLGRAAITGDVLVGAGSNVSVFRNVAAVSVVGNPTTGSATPVDISAGVNGDVLQQISGVLGFAPLAYSSLTGAPAAITALTGDVTATGPGSVAATLRNIPTGVTAAGDVSFAPTVAPGAPGAGHALVYVDSTSLNLAVVSSAGVVNHGVQSNPGAAHKWVSVIADDGSVTLTQPAYGDLSGSVPAITQLTGDVAAGPGSGSQAATLATVNADVGSFTNGSFTVNGKGLITAASSGPAAVTAVGATVPATSTGGATPTIGVLFDNASITLNGSNQLQRAALGGDLTSTSGSNSIDVIALHETSGPTRLTLGAIPDSAPAATVLVRPTGTGTIVGVDVRSLAGPESLHYFMNIASWPVNQGWIATSDFANFYTGLAVEYPVQHAAKTVTLVANLIANGLTTSGVTAAVTRNGSSVIGAVFNMSTTTTPGVYSSGPITLSSSASTDTFGVSWSNSASGSVKCAFTVFVN